MRLSKRYPTEKEINKAYNRSGKCNGCGECCKYMVFRCNNTDEWIDYAKGFGEIAYLDGVAYSALNISCRYLVGNKCQVYHNRPEPCRQFPYDSDCIWNYVKDKCGYTFKSKEKQKMGME